MRTKLIAGQIIVGDGSSPIPNAAVIVEDDRIVFAGKASDSDEAPVDKVVDLGDATILPGLIDTHVHITNDGGVGNSKAAIRNGLESPAELALQGYSNAYRSLQFGYTTLRSVHSPMYVDVAIRNSINQGRNIGPRLLVSGQGLCITGGHMDKSMFPEHVSVVGRVGVCDTPEGFRQAVRQHMKHKVDLIKINTDVGSLKDPSRPSRQEMSFEEMKAACDEAHHFGLRVASHTSGGVPIEEALKAGVDTIEHGHWLTERAIELMLEREAFYVPTLIVNSKNFDYDQETLGASDESWEWVTRAFEAKWDSLTRAKEAGVKIAAGSDAGFLVNHGENAEELEELVKGGFTPLEAIQAATETSADLLGLKHEIGTVQAGKKADIIVCASDPLSDITVLQRESLITHVIRDGLTVKSPDLAPHFAG